MTSGIRKEDGAGEKGGEAEEEEEEEEEQEKGDVSRWCYRGEEQVTREARAAGQEPPFRG